MASTCELAGRQGPPSPAINPPAPDESTTGKHIPALDGIRGVALLLVFALHFLWSAPYTGHNPVIWLGATIRDIGWMGVDLFFVLSGFLITGILYDTRQTPHFFRNFYARRALRIFPLFYAYVLIALLIMHLAGGYLGPGVRLELFTYTFNLRLPFALGASDPRPEWVKLNHLWSLAVEEQFYVVWPLIVFLLRGKRKIAAAAASLLGISVVLKVLYSHGILPMPDPFMLESFTPLRLDGLCMGAIAAMVIRSRWRKPAIDAGKWVFFAGLLALVGMSFRYPYLRIDVWPWITAWAYPLIALMFAGMLLWSLRATSVAGRILSHASLRFFGRYSYGMYIFHYTVLFATQGSWRPLLEARVHSKLVAILAPAVVGVIVTIALSMLSFHFFELPLLRLKRHFGDHTRHKRLAGVVETAAS